MRETTLGAYAHQDLPFEKLVEELRPERELNRNPFFQAMFALQNAPLGDLVLPGLIFSPQEFESGATRFDLECHLREAGGKLVGQLIFSTDLFRRETAERMVSHFEILLEGIAADADQSIAALPLLPEHEKHQLLVEWQGPVAEFPREKCVHQLFEEQAELAPEPAALEHGAERLSYGELNRRANQLAQHLRRVGVGPDTVVGICVERSSEMMLAVLAALKAGGAYLPLDLSYPRERLQFMLEDARAHVLLTQERFTDALAGYGTPLICLDRDWPEISVESEAQPVSGVTSANLAYVVYTSGSTGQPKGVAMTHRALVNLLGCNTRAPPRRRARCSSRP